MSNQIHGFKDRDVQRFYKSCTKAAGRPPSVVELNPKTGAMRAVFDRSAEKGSSTVSGNDLDAELEAFEAHHGGQG